MGQRLFYGMELNLPTWENLNELILNAKSYKGGHVCVHPNAADVFKLSVSCVFPECMLKK